MMRAHIFNNISNKHMQLPSCRHYQIVQYVTTPGFLLSRVGRAIARTLIRGGGLIHIFSSARPIPFESYLTF